ncbi:MAG: hypothetical protein GY714_12560 [Desulfobacterales bacterium]|nr:hypothetical protein [Desulfobacterales bacterium]
MGPYFVNTYWLFKWVFDTGGIGINFVGDQLWITNLNISKILIGSVKNASRARKLVDISRALLFQDADKKHNGKAPDGYLIFWRLKLKW